MNIIQKGNEFRTNSIYILYKTIDNTVIFFSDVERIIYILQRLFVVKKLHN